MNEDELQERIDNKMALMRGEEPPHPQEPEEEETPEAPVEDAPESGEQEGRLYAGRYKTIEELERAIEEKEAMIVRQADEVGEVRQEIAALRAETEGQFSNLRSEDFDPDEEWEEWADERITEAQAEGSDMEVLEAIIAAGDEGGPAAARWMLNRWYQKDAAAATSFQLIAHSLYGGGDAQTAESVPESTEPESDEAQQAWDSVLVRHPDMAQFRPDMGQALLNMDRREQSAWERRIAMEPAAAEEFVEHLYLRTKSGREQPRPDTQAEDQAAKEATLASATASLSRQVAPPSRSTKKQLWDKDAFREAAGLTPRE